MEDYLKILLDGNGIVPPSSCILSLMNNFESAINIEWFEKGSLFEAVFYQNELEHIAIFEPDGKLLEYKVMLPVNLLPELIRSTMETRGEIMNSVLKNKQNGIEYEIILRENDHTRLMINFSELGKILEEKKL